MVSFICCYNDQVLMDGLAVCIQKYCHDYEIIPIDNTHMAFDSAASALNYGFSLSKGDILLFLHQDIVIGSGSDIDGMFSFLNEHPRSILGVAGVSDTCRDHCTLSNISDPKHPNGYNSISQPEAVFSLDECMLAVKREVFEEIGMFDSVTFDGWHLYGFGLCMQAKERSIPSFVYPVRIHHMSSGKIDDTWRKCWNRARKKYRHVGPQICSTCGWTYTNPILHHSYAIYRALRKRLKI